MRKVREYKGCEFESPMFRQIMAEREKGLNGSSIMDGTFEYKPKRGKHKI
jgi:hypothetical protein